MSTNLLNTDETDDDMLVVDPKKVKPWSPTKGRPAKPILEDEDEDADLIDEDPPANEDARDDEDADEDEDEIVETRVKPGVVRRRAKVKHKEEAPVMKQKQKERRATLPEIPREEILGLRHAGYQTINLEIKRRLPSGKIGEVRKGILMPPEGLFDVSDAVRAFAGGGNFIFYVTDTATRAVICSIWEETYDGMPKQCAENLTLVWNDEQRVLVAQQKAATLGIVDGFGGGVVGSFGGGQSSLGSSLSAGLTGGSGMDPLPQMQYDVRGNVLPPPAELVPSWMRTFPVHVQWDHVVRTRQADGQQQGGAPVAKEWVHHEIRERGDLKAQVSQLSAQLQQQSIILQERLEKVKGDADAKLEAEREARVRAERELERTREESRTNELRAQIDSLRMEMARPKEKTGIDSVALLAAAAPVITAYLSKGADERRYDLEDRRHAQEAQFRFLAEATKKKDDGLLSMLKDFGPILAPLALKWIDNNGPAAYSEALSIEHEQKLMQLKMIYDMLQAQMPEPDPVWKQVMDGLAGMFSPMINKMLLPPPPQPRVPQIGTGAQQQHGAADQAQQQQQEPPRETILDRLAVQDPQAAQQVQLIYSRLSPDLGFHSHEWITVIFNIHARLDPDELSPKIVSLLANNEAFGNLPLPLEHVFDNEESARATLTSVFTPLPISQIDPEYAAALLEAVLEDLKAMKDEDEEDLVDAGSNGTVEATVVEDAPKKRGNKSKSTPIVTPSPSS